MSAAALDWKPDDIPDLSGKTILITGANSGLGLETSRLLAGHGARVVMACRNQQKGEAAMADIRNDIPDTDLELMQLDLADLASVSGFVDAFKRRFARLDVLINNAGLMAPPFSQTVDGFELQFGTNHLGHFALTAPLLETLSASDDPRIVVVSSVAHRMGNIYFDNLHGEKGYKRWKFYGQSKLANLIFALELDRRLRAAGSRIKVMAVHPGYSATHLQDTVPGGRIFNAMLAQSQVQGSYPSVFAATSPQAKSGDYYGPNGFKEMRGMPAPASMRKLARNTGVAKRLWRASEELTLTEYGLPG
jgi:NAD(P)-dependent dehydrogenase (short-subunit alcohol dehydrogenase family)